MQNASALEIWSVIMMGIAFLGTLAGLVWLAIKYVIYRRPTRDGKRPNGVAVLIFAQSALLYSALGILSGLLFVLSVMALFAPPAIRQQNQQQNAAVVAVFIGLSVLVDGCVIGNVWLTSRIDKAIAREKERHP